MGEYFSGYGCNKWSLISVESPVHGEPLRNNGSMIK